MAFATIFGTDLPIITGGSLSSAGSSFSITSDGLSLGVPAPDSTTGQISNINQLTLTDLSVAPNAPGTGKFTLYSKSGSLYYKSGTGAETLVGSGGGGASLSTANTWTATQTFSNSTYSALFTGGNVGIGTTSPGAALDVAGTLRLNGTTVGTNYTEIKAASSATATTYTLPSAVPSTTGQVLSSDTSGNMSWITAAGSNRAIAFSILFR